jgi:hypothetical protein
MMAAKCDSFLFILFFLRVIIIKKIIFSEKKIFVKKRGDGDVKPISPLYFLSELLLESQLNCEQLHFPQTFYRFTNIEVVCFG